VTGQGSGRAPLVGKNMSARDDSCPYGGASSSRDNWMVLRTKRHRERSVHASLLREGVPAYLPLVREWPRPAVGADVVPMFPGYVFCQPPPAQLDRVAATNGVAGFVRFGDRPASVPPEVIGYLRSRASGDGIISLDLEFAGRQVTITDGPLRGLPAVIERRMTGRQRVLVLLDLLQRPTRVELPDRWLRLA
jgi:transcriptional antiterminator RfaH